jgi:histidinol-phosphatase (PHP family)
LDFIASRGLAVEISTAGWRKPVNEIYPSEQVIKLALAKNIPVTTASDAHSHVQLADKFDQLGQKLAELGVRKVCVYERHKRIVKALTC